MIKPMATPLYRITEAALRRALLEQLRANAQASDLIIEELGVEQGAARIDVAVAAQRFAGYEIKSDFDTLDRLARQMHAYHRVFDTLTIVTTDAYVAQVAVLLPAWWGIVVGRVAADHGVVLETIRGPSSHPYQDARSLASLMWRDDAYAFALEHLDSGVKSRATRDALYDLIAESVPVEAIKARVRTLLHQRLEIRQQAKPQKLPDASCLTV